MQARGSHGGWHVQQLAELLQLADATGTWVFDQSMEDNGHVAQTLPVHNHTASVQRDLWVANQLLQKGRRLPLLLTVG